MDMGPSWAAHISIVARSKRVPYAAGGRLIDAGAQQLPPLARDGVRRRRAHRRYRHLGGHTADCEGQRVRRAAPDYRLKTGARRRLQSVASDRRTTLSRLVLTLFERPGAGKRSAHRRFFDRKSLCEGSRPKAFQEVNRPNQRCNAAVALRYALCLAASSKRWLLCTVGGGRSFPTFLGLLPSFRKRRPDKRSVNHRIPFPTFLGLLPSFAKRRPDKRSTNHRIPLGCHARHKAGHRDCEFAEARRLDDARGQVHGAYVFIAPEAPRLRDPQRRHR